MPLAEIVNQGSLNLAALQAPGVVVVIVPPPLYGQPLPTDTAAVLGTASWGQVNSPQLCGSTLDVNQNFGGINGMVSYNDVHDLPSHAAIAFQQATANGSMQLWGVRITDGTDVAATYALKDTTPTTPLTGGTATAFCTGVYGNTISISITAGIKTGTYTVTIAAPFRGNKPEIFANLPGTGAGVFWTALANALQFGTNTRGPSQLLRLAAPSLTAIAPAVGTYTLTGGTDGRTGVTTTNFIGSSSANGTSTGVYCLAGLNPTVNMFWLAGFTDTTVWTTLSAFADSIGANVTLAFASGTTTTAAVTSKQSFGIDDYNVNLCRDWLYWYDGVNGLNRFVEPSPFIVGRMACLSPEQSPGNKYVQGVTGSERSTQNGNNYYQPAELAQLTANGIMVICNPINRGNAWGIFHGKSSSSNPVTAPIEYGRMTNYIAKSFGAILGPFVDELQSSQSNDPLRNAVKLALDTFCQSLQTNNQIDAFLNTCDLTNNTPATIAQGYLYATAQVKYLRSADFIVVNLEGGSTELGALQGVTATISTAGQSTSTDSTTLES